MDITIGADAVRLADLQIDALSKYRTGQLSLDHWERFVNLSPEAREERFGDGKRPASARTIELVVKFGLLADLGIITVPTDYKLVTEFVGGSFPNPTRVLKPGNRLWVRAHKQIVDGVTTSEERMAFLKTLNSHLVGVQGIELVEPKRRQLPKSYWYASFDEKERLWFDAGRYHRVPGVLRYFSYGFSRGLGRFERPWRGGSAVLSFCDPALRPLDT